MRRCSLFFGFLFCLLAITVMTISGQERNLTNEFIPEPGLEGKDVDWIPTPLALVEKMLELAEITPEDFLLDLGSGDGRLVITAAGQGTRAMGIEYNPDLVNLSKKLAEREGVAGLTQFVEADIYEFDFSGATVITMFLLPQINMKLRPILLNLKPGTRIVSNTFTMQEWQYDGEVRTADKTGRWNTAYLWIVPARAEGKWIIPQKGELIIRQQFQNFTGSLSAGGESMDITEGKIRGSEIIFYAGGKHYTGIISGNKIEGETISGNKTEKWNAARH